MLQEVNGTIQELAQATMTSLTTTAISANGANGCGHIGSSSAGYYGNTFYGTPTIDITPVPYYYYQSYPVYVCTDKTKKAIDVLKALEADKLIKCQSVPKFIALVEKIAGLL